jgi:hypothetical protein
MQRRSPFRPRPTNMRQYLNLTWILGPVVACALACGSEAGSSNDDGGTPPMSSAGQQSPPTTSGGAQSGGGPSNAAGVSSGGVAGTSVSPNAGMPAVSGTSNQGGSSSSGGAARTGTGGGTMQKPIPDFKFPMASGADKKLGSTMEVTDLDGKMTRYVGSGDLGSGGNTEGQDPLFRIKAGGSLKNVILGAPAADGIHCEGSCTIENVWWEDVGEDAITLEGSSSGNQYRITGGGARKATDKVIQHNGGGTLYVKNFLVEEFGKLYRSCGNCDDQYERHAEFDTIVANGTKGVLAGVNEKYHDSAKFKNIFADITMKICERYEGNDQGQDTDPLGSGADGTYCLYSASDIAWH